MTMEELEALEDRISKNPNKAKIWWPKVEEIKERIEPNINNYIEFLIWIVETANEPVEEWEIESKNYINRLLRKTIKIIDEEDQI